MFFSNEANSFAIASGARYGCFWIKGLQGVSFVALIARTCATFMCAVFGFSPSDAIRQWKASTAFRGLHSVTYPDVAPPRKQGECFLLVSRCHNLRVVSLMNMLNWLVFATPIVGSN